MFFFVCDMAFKVVRCTAVTECRVACSIAGKERARVIGSRVCRRPWFSSKNSENHSHETWGGGETAPVVSSTSEIQHRVSCRMSPPSKSSRKNHSSDTLGGCRTFLDDPPSLYLLEVIGESTACSVLDYYLFSLYEITAA